MEKVEFNSRALREDVKILKKDLYREVYVIDNEYILKKSTIERIKAEKIFFDTYKANIFEKVAMYEEGSEYILYKYIKNKEINLYKCDFKKYIAQILRIVQKYKTTYRYGYGDVLTPVNTWSAYLNQEIERKRKNLMHEDEKFLKVKKAIKKIRKFKFEKKLIHGDLGIYNVLFKNNKIIGIIDPRTIIGDAIYDFIYFLFSHITIMESITIPEIIDMLQNEPKEKIINLMYIILYDRISIETKHNRARIGEYEKLWEKLKKQEEKMKKFQII